MPKRMRLCHKTADPRSDFAEDIIDSQAPDCTKNRSSEDSEGDGLTCPVCLEPCWNPVFAVPCAHMGCQECMERLATCPLCRTSLTDLVPCSAALRERAHGTMTSCANCSWRGTRMEQRDANHEECPDEGMRLAQEVATRFSLDLGDDSHATVTAAPAGNLSFQGICKGIMSVVDQNDALTTLKGLFHLAHCTFGPGCFRTTTRGTFASDMLILAAQRQDVRNALVQRNLLGDLWVAAGGKHFVEEGEYPSWAQKMLNHAMGTVIDWPLLRQLRSCGFDFNTARLPNERTVLKELVAVGTVTHVGIAVRELGCDVNATPHSETALIMAATKDHPLMVERLLDLGALPDAVNDTKQTALFRAAILGHLECAQLLVRAKANLEVRVGGVGATPLFVAAQCGHLDVVKLLAEHGADMEAALVTDGAPPLYIAAQKGHTHVVQYLHQQGASLKPRVGPPQMNAAVAAITHGHVETASFLVGLGLSVGEVLADGSTALYIVARYGFVAAARFLLVDQRVDPNVPCEYGYTALHHAAFFGRLDVVKELAEHGADLHRTAANGRTAVAAAAGEGNLEVLRFLLDRGVPFRSSNPTVHSPMYLAAQENYPECVRLLAERGADVNEVLEPQGLTPLLVASSEGSRECVKLLLSLGANPDAKTVRGITPLWSAASNGHRDVVELLLRHEVSKNQGRRSGGGACAAVDVRDADFRATPLYAAAHFGHHAVVRMLAEHGANVNAQASDGRSPVFAAAVEGHGETVRVLTSLGADVNLPDSIGAAPLVIAVMNQKEKAVYYLLEAGADINYQTPGGGSTPLIVAVGNKNPSWVIMEYLLARKPNVMLRTHQGHTALVVAAQYGHREWLGRIAQLVPRETTDGAECLQEAFEVAVSRGDADCVKELIEFGVNLDAEDDEGHSLLLQSADATNLDVAKLLTSHGARCCCRADKSGARLLSLLAERGDDCAEMLTTLRTRAEEESASGRRPASSGSRKAPPPKPSAARRAKPSTKKRK